MTYRVVFTLRARADALEAFRWIAERSPDAAARWSAGLEKAIAALRQNPARHPVAEEETEQFGITILRMLYGRRRGYTASFSPSKGIPSPCTMSAIVPVARLSLDAGRPPP